MLNQDNALSYIALLYPLSSLDIVAHGTEFLSGAWSKSKMNNEFAISIAELESQVSYSMPIFKLLLKIWIFV